MEVKIKEIKSLARYKRNKKFGSLLEIQNAPKYKAEFRKETSWKSEHGRGVG